MTLREEISIERKEPSTSEVAHIRAELALFKGVTSERVEILGAVLAPLNSNATPVFSKLVFHMVQFGSHNQVDLAQKLVPKTASLQWGRIELTRFGPTFWAKSTLFILQCRALQNTTFQ